MSDDRLAKINTLLRMFDLGAIAEKTDGGYGYYNVKVGVTNTYRSFSNLDKAEAYAHQLMNERGDQ